MDDRNVNKEVIESFKHISPISAKRRKFFSRPQLSLIATVLLGLILISCGSPQGEKTGKAKQSNSGVLQVVATTGMIGDLAINIGKEKVRVQSLMGPGVDPHLYKASAGDVQRLLAADLILYNGLHLEAKMGDVLKRMKDKGRAVSRLISGSDLLKSEGYADAVDPHIWFDINLWKEAAVEVARCLEEKDGQNSNFYRANLKTYLQKMDDLQKYIQKKVSSLPKNQRVLITAHDAFHYFGRAYGFVVKGLQGISTVSEAGTKDVQLLADFIAKKKIPAIFIESSVPRKNVEALQAAVQSRGFQVLIGGELYSDAMGNPGTDEGSYLGMVRHNVDTIVNALSRTKAH